jgi:hypothetical protein
LLGIDPEDPFPPSVVRIDHTDPDGKTCYMKTTNRGNWGFECTYDNCHYYVTYGERYFYH